MNVSNFIAYCPLLTPALKREGSGVPTIDKELQDCRVQSVIATTTVIALTVLSFSPSLLCLSIPIAFMAVCIVAEVQLNRRALDRTYIEIWTEAEKTHTIHTYFTVGRKIADTPHLLKRVIDLRVPLKFTQTFRDQRCHVRDLAEYATHEIVGDYIRKVQNPNPGSNEVD